MLITTVETFAWPRRTLLVLSEVQMSGKTPLVQSQAVFAAERAAAR
jgi:hypothetical protein